MLVDFNGVVESAINDPFGFSLIIIVSALAFRGAAAFMRDIVSLKVKYLG